MFGTWARGLEPRPHHWNNSHRVGLGFWGEVGISPDAPGHPCGHFSPGLGCWGPPQGCQGVPRDSPSSSVPTSHRLGMLLWEGTGLGMPLPSVLTGCIGSRARVGRAGLKPRSGMTWARLISSLNCCRQKSIFSCSLMIFFSLSLLLPIIEHLEGYF